MTETDGRGHLASVPTKHDVIIAPSRCLQSPQRLVLHASASRSAEFKQHHIISQLIKKQRKNRRTRVETRGGAAS